MSRRQRFNGPALAGLVLTMLAACNPEPEDGSAGSLDPGTPSQSSAELATTLGFRKQITVSGIREHLAAFEAAAELHGGSRALGTPGYDASAAYVRDRLVAAGYDAALQEFSFEFRGDVRLPVFARTSPQATAYAYGSDFRPMDGSGSADVTAPVQAVDFLVPVPVAGVSTSGCEAADFAGFPPGSIALIQRGTCTFRVKAINAAAAGAVGVIVANDGGPGRTGIIGGTLDVPGPASSLPVVGTTFAIGEELRQGILNGSTGSTVRLDVEWVAETRTGSNVIAETRTGNVNQVIVVGTGLESWALSPGINHGSGAATVLEIAEVMSQQGRTATPRIRFIWFGGGSAERSGAEAYLAGLSSEARGRIKGMLDIRPIGAPNFGRFVFDGDGSTFTTTPAPADGSDTIERLLTGYFADVSLAQEAGSLDDAGDHTPFLEAGIPVGGLSGGGAAIKTAAQAAAFGGTAGAAFDPCFGAPCDVLASPSATALDQLSDAAAHAVLLLSKRNLEKNPL